MLCQLAKVGKQEELLEPLLLGVLKTKRRYLSLRPLPAIPATISAIPGYINAVGRFVSSEIKPVTGWA